MFTDLPAPTDLDKTLGGPASSDDATGLTGPDWLESPPRSELAPGFRLLCVGPTEPDWISLTLQLDAVGCHDPRFRWVSTSAEAMSLLRNEAFDSIVIACDAVRGLPWDGIALLHAIRASGCDDPIVLMTTSPNDQIALEACEHHCELLASPARWSSRALVSVIRRAIELVETARENHHLAVANQRRLVRERDEADHLLKQQRDIIHELESLAYGFSAADVSGITGCSRSRTGTAPDDDTTEPGSHPTIPVPDEIRAYYQELLRTYVIMGSGNLGGEIGQLARILAQAELSPRDTLSLHLERVEELVRGLGNRSTRHVMARADLLALELIIHLGECYQQAAG